MHHVLRGIDGFRPVEITDISGWLSIYRSNPRIVITRFRKASLGESVIARGNSFDRRNTKESRFAVRSSPLATNKAQNESAETPPPSLSQSSSIPSLVTPIPPPSHLRRHHLWRLSKLRCLLIISMIYGAVQMEILSAAVAINMLMNCSRFCVRACSCVRVLARA